MIAADRRRLTPALGVLAVLLAALLIALWAGVGRGAHWNDDAAPPPLPPVRAATPPPSVPPLDAFAMVWEKPLFSPDRKPIAAAPGSGNADNSGDLELTGVIMLPGLHLALLREKSSGRTLRVREGQSANGATVVEVDPRSAVIEVNGSRVELPLKVGPPPANNGAGDNAQQPASESTVQMQEGDNIPPAATASAPPPPQPMSARAPKQDNPTQEANEAWEQALKARIQQRRKQAAPKQNDGG